MELSRKIVFLLLFTASQALQLWGGRATETEVDFAMAKTHKNYLMPKDIVLLARNPRHSKLCKSVQGHLRNLVRRHSLDHLKQRYAVILKICQLPRTLD